LTKQGLSEENIALKLEEWKKLKEANLAALMKKKSEKVKIKKASSEKSDKTDSEAEVKGTASE